MKEKEQVKIAIGEAIAIIVIVVLAIVALGGMIYQNLNIKKEEEDLRQQISEFEQQIEDLNNENDKKQEILNSISLQIQKQQQNNKKITDESAISIAKDKYEKIKQYYWITGDINNAISTNEGDNSYYLINNYDEITDNITGEALQQFKQKRGIIEKDGKYYINDIARGANITYFGCEGFEIKSVTENELKLSVKEKYCENYEAIKKEYTYKNNNFTLVKENNVWKVSEFTLPN